MILSLGRWHKGPERALYEHYADRAAKLGRRLKLDPLELQEIGGRRAGDETPEALIAACPADAVRIALDPAGAALSSEAFAGLVDGYRTRGTPAVAFLIGGADGLGTILGRVHKTLSLGPQTWPHLLVRGLLAEQIYRAETLLLNHPYHRGH